MLLEETAALSDKISLQVHNFQLEKEQADEFKIDKIPATIVMADKDIGIRFYGIPGGYEYASLLESIELVSTDKSPGFEAGTSLILFVDNLETMPSDTPSKV